MSDLYLRPFAKINKESLSFALSSKVEVEKKEILTAYIKDEETGELILVTNDCIDNNKDFIFEKSYYTDPLLENFKNLSRTQILQYIAYHFLPSNSAGETDIFLEKDIAEFLNISLKTVRRNNKILVALGLIKIQVEARGIISIVITNYKEAFEKKSKGTCNITIDFFKELISLDKNSLKIAISLFNDTSATKVFYGQEAFTSLRASKYKNILVKSKQYRKFLYNKFLELKSLFEFKTDTKTLDHFDTNVLNIKFSVLNTFNFHKNEGIVLKENNHIINQLVEELNLKNTYKLKKDLLELSITYGISYIKEAFNTLPVDIYSINNFCGYIRNYIRDKYIELNNLDWNLSLNPNKIFDTLKIDSIS